MLRSDVAPYVDQIEQLSIACSNLRDSLRTHGAVPQEECIALLESAGLAKTNLTALIYAKIRAISKLQSRAKDLGNRIISFSEGTFKNRVACFWRVS